MCARLFGIMLFCCYNDHMTITEEIVYIVCMPFKFYCYNGHILDTLIAVHIFFIVSLTEHCFSPVATIIVDFI